MTNSTTQTAAPTAAAGDSDFTAVPGTQRVNEDETLVFRRENGNAIEVTGLGNGLVTVVLSIADGRLDLGFTGSLAHFAGNGTSRVTLTGTGSAVNAALDGLSYTGARDANGLRSLSVTTYDLSGGNRIVNGNAESDSGAGDYRTVVVPFAWTAVKGGMTAVRYDIGSNEDLNSADGRAVAGGAAYFAGGPEGASTLRQRINVGTLSQDIDGGLITASLEGFFGGFREQADAMTMTVRFLSSSLQELGSAQVGGVTPQDRTNVSQLLHAGNLASVPAGTRYIDVVLNAAAPSGDYNDGYADNLSLILARSDSDAIAIEIAPVPEWVYGTGGADTLYGTADPDYIDGLAGADYLEGRGGDDLLVGNDGDDTLDGGTGVDTLDGGDGLDTAVLDRSASAAAVDLDLAAGETLTLADGTTLTGIEALVFTGGALADSVAAGDLTDILRGGGGADRLFGRGGADSLSGEAGDDLLDGGGEDDILNGGAGADSLLGGAGNDVLIGGGGGDRFDGGEGSDLAVIDVSTSTGENILDLSAAAGTTATLSDGTTVTNVERITYKGGTARDRITGGNLGDTIDGGDGDDIIFSLGGDDVLSGGKGRDELFGGSGVDTLLGGDGDDILDDTSGDGLIDGGEGVDKASIDRLGGTTGIVLDISTGAPSTLDRGGTVINIEILKVRGSEVTDRIVGGAYADVINGWAGDDRIEGGAGDDLLTGGRGDDRVFGQGGNDVLDGGEGDDYLDATGGGTDRIDGGAGIDTAVLSMDGSDAPNLIDLSTGLKQTLSNGTTFENIERLQYLGGSGRDEVTGGAGTDFIDGGDGADRIDGGGGDDELNGGKGDDVVSGGAGSDWLHGGEGVDILVGDSDDELIDGGEGVDLARLDFRSVTEKLDFSVAESAAAGDVVTIGSTDLMISGIEAVEYRGGSGSDRVTGGDYRDLLEGNAGGDELLGGGGDDLIDGGEGSDTLSDQTLLMTGDGRYATIDSDTINGGGGDDLVLSNVGADSLDGGTGTDLLILNRRAMTEAVEFVGTVTAEQRLADGTRFSNFEYYTVYGGSGNDRMTGGDYYDSLFGGGGADILAGGGLDDKLYGEDGSDRLDGGTGADKLYGGADSDTLDGGAGDDVMEGGSGDDSYAVDTLGDSVVEAANAGRDEVRTALSGYQLPANVEALVYTGAAAAVLRGNALDNSLTGGDSADTFLLQDGGSDHAVGGGGNDAFYMGAAMDSGDRLDGGFGTLDQVGLQGNYAGLVLGPQSLAGIEMLVFLSGADTRFGDGGGKLYSYNVTLDDGNVAPGQQLIVSFNTLLAGENVTFDGSAEKDGSFLTFGGLGADRLVGSQQNDGFFFGTGGRFGADDRVDGQGGSLDQIGLQGDYTGIHGVNFGHDQIAGIELIALLSGSDARFGSGGASYSYELTMDDGNVAAGHRMTISANTLRAGETLSFEGQGETDGAFTIYSGDGADTLEGGAGADEIWGRGGDDEIAGGLGGDRLIGGAGSDVFVYREVAESTGLGFDTLVGFEPGSDKIKINDRIPVEADVIGSAEGALSRATFDQDLADGVFGRLAPHSATLFNADGGDFAGRSFLVVDADGDGLYHSGSDFVFEIVAPVSPIVSGADIFFAYTGAPA